MNDKRPEDKFDDWGDRKMPMQPVQYIGHILPRVEPKIDLSVEPKHGYIVLTQSTNGAIIKVTRHPRAFDDSRIGNMHELICHRGWPTDIDFQDRKASSIGLYLLQLKLWNEYVNGSGVNLIHHS